jgi:hypothetical protein
MVRPKRSTAGIPAQRLRSQTPRTSRQSESESNEPSGSDSPTPRRRSAKRQSESNRSKRNKAHEVLVLETVPDADDYTVEASSESETLHSDEDADALSVNTEPRCLGATFVACAFSPHATIPNAFNCILHPTKLASGNSVHKTVVKETLKATQILKVT